MGTNWEKVNTPWKAIPILTRRKENMLSEEVIRFVVVAVGIANICLLLALLYIYGGTYRKLKSRFTIGIIFFALLLLIQNIMFTAVFLFHEGFHGPGMGSPMFLLKIIECIALSVLLKITWE